MNLATPARPAPGWGRAAASVDVSFREHLGERICIVEPSDRAPSAQLIFVHGLSDHLGRQLRFARWLAGQGYRAVSFELRAHGGQPAPWADSSWVYEAYAATESPRDTMERLAKAPQEDRERARDLALRQYEALQRTRGALVGCPGAVRGRPAPCARKGVAPCRVPFLAPRPAGA